MVKFEGSSGGRVPRSLFGIETRRVPPWAMLSLVTNGMLLLTVAVLVVRNQKVESLSDAKTAIARSSLSEAGFKVTELGSSEPPVLGPRHKWTYEQWVAQLGREAEAIAANPPQRLTILAGDSLSLWFPVKLLPPDRTWLNQGISGETSTGLLKRLQLFDRTQPNTIFVMIGINDLIRGVTEETIVENQRQIIRDLRWFHPSAQVVIQSILPHGAEGSTWEGRDRLLAIPNSRIRELNDRLKTIATSEEVLYLDLHPLFTDSQGNLRLELSTDGLHLNDRGYLVWRSALQLFSQLELSQ